MEKRYSKVPRDISTTTSRNFIQPCPPVRCPNDRAYAQSPAKRIKLASSRYSSEAAQRRAALADYDPHFDSDDNASESTSDPPVEVPALSTSASLQSSSQVSNDAVQAQNPYHVASEAFLSRYSSVFLDIQTKFHLSDAALDAVLKANFSFFDQPGLPSSLYMMKKASQHSAELLSLTYACSECSSVLDQATKLCPTASCRFASMPCANLNCGYASLDIAAQIQRICAGYYDRMLAYATLPQDEDSISDIINCQAYSDFGPNPDADETLHLRLILHSDGAPLLQTIAYSITPIQLAIVELPPLLRQSFKCTIFAGYFIGGSAMDRSRLFEPALQQLADLAEEGVSFLTSSGVQAIVKVDLFACVFDAKERAMVLNMKQFNGFFGCHACLAEGKASTKRKKGGDASTARKGPLIYPNTQLGQLRTPAHYAEGYAEAAVMTTKFTQFGFKGQCHVPSLIPRLPTACWFDLMHVFYIGTLKNLLQTMLKRCPQTGWDYMEKKKLAIVDRLIASVKWPSDFSRKCGQLSDCINWKAQEFAHFTLILPVLINLVKDINALASLVTVCSAISILTSDLLTPEDIDRAERLIIAFHSDLRRTFNASAQRFNAHCLLHLPAQARAFGPLQTQGCFAFESHLYSAASLRCGVRGYLRQIGVRLCSKIGATGDIVEAEAAPGKRATVVGAVKAIVLSQLETDAARGHAMLSQAKEKLCGPTKMKLGYVTFASAANKRLVNTADSYVKYRTSLGLVCFGQILNFVEYGRKYYALVLQFPSSNKTMWNYVDEPTYENLLAVHEEKLACQNFVEVFSFPDRSRMVDVIRVERILSRCMFVPSQDGKTFAVSLPRNVTHD